MKRYVLSMMLAIMFVPALAVAQEEGPEDIEFQIEMHERKMELQHREILLALAEEEVKHKLRFETEYDLLLRKS